MKSIHTSNNIIPHNRKSKAVFPMFGMHETLDASSYFSYIYCSISGDEFVYFIDRSNNSIDSTLHFKHIVADIQLTDNNPLYLNQTFSFNLKNL
ncbi:hypothetical protein [Maribacter sp.]|uniref:hypothetical protein n=1 Tax=Maribacter sp. TaxID=1897614 RepID=UPI00329A5316